MTTYPAPDPPPKSFVTLITICTFVSWCVLKLIKVEGKRHQYKVHLRYLTHSQSCWQGYLCKFPSGSVGRGISVAAPEPRIAGKGLKSIQTGFGVQAMSMSAKKVVVSL